MALFDDLFPIEIAVDDLDPVFNREIVVCGRALDRIEQLEIEAVVYNSVQAAEELWNLIDAWTFLVDGKMPETAIVKINHTVVDQPDNSPDEPGPLIHCDTVLDTISLHYWANSVLVYLYDFEGNTGSDL